MGERLCPNDTPRMFVQRTGLRGWMAWETWVEHGMLRFAGEYGTYAWTRKQAERKGRRLMAKLQRIYAADATREEIRPVAERDDPPRVEYERTLPTWPHAQTETSGRATRKPGVS